jgi:predicted aminopeptidase
MVLWGMVVACLLAASGPAQTVGERIAELKEFQKTLGWEPPRSFARVASKRAYYRCYYTGKLELPSSYEELKLREGDEAGCKLDENKYDVFFYRIEAVAAEDAPVTEALAESSAERLAVVVLHEDFHQQEAVRRLPETIAEAASTLAGFAAAAEFARTRWGADSDTHRKLAREVELYLTKSRLVNEAHRRLSAVYESHRQGKLSRDEALMMKQRELAELERRCLEIQPEPASFNRCLPVANNAGLAFDHTYTRHYPLVYELYRALGGDLRAFKAALDEAARSRAAVVRHLEGVILRARSSGDSGP